MKIDGKLIASEIKNKLISQVENLRRRKIIPHLAVIIIGSDPASLIYIKRKKIFGEEVGVKVTVISQQETESGGTRKTLVKLVTRLNNDKSVHGIIIQRPVPIDIEKNVLDRLVIPQKDVDGFHPQSIFNPPIGKAVLRILDWVMRRCKPNTHGKCISLTPSYKSGKEEFSKKLFNWFKKQKILIIGRGETAGQPIAKYFHKLNIPFIVAHSQTKNMKELCLSSDIIISCVGRPHIVRHDMVTPESIVIGVGLHPENDKLQTDYNQEEIAKAAGFYTPVPGGVGPVNVACLFKNLIEAASQETPLKLP